MPITGPASYVPVTEEFLNHWTPVNAALPASAPFAIPGPAVEMAAPVTRAVLQGLYDGLLAQHAVVQTHITSDDLAGEDVSDLKVRLLDKLNQFNDKVRGMLPNTKWSRRLPAVPGISESRSKFSDPLESALNLWARINDDGALGQDVPLTLRGDYLQDDFSIEMGDLRTAYRAAKKAEDELGLEREERNDMQDVLYKVLKQYRALMPSFFEPNNALVESLPLISPTGSRTPDPVAATASWDAPAQAAKIEWAASTDSDLDHYEVRWSPGTQYHADDESTLGTIQPDSARLFQTDQGLAAPGARSLFRVYVVLKTGHEASGETLVVTRT